MYVFIDESGDSGLKRLKGGSSSHFTMGATVFSTSASAERCSHQMDAIRRELGFGRQVEFHFSKTSERNRRIFFERIRNEDFSYFACCLDKKRVQTETQFLRKEFLYQESVRRLMGLMQPHVENAVACFDR